MLVKFGGAYTLDRIEKMPYRDAMILRWCMECEAEATKLKLNESESESSKIVDPRGVMMLKGMEIPEEWLYDDD